MSIFQEGTLLFRIRLALTAVPGGPQNSNYMPRLGPKLVVALLPLM